MIFWAIAIHVFILTIISGVYSPILLAGALLIRAILTSIQLGLVINRWFFYFINLVFLGGVIVVVLFLCSVCSNNKLSFISSTRYPQLANLTILLILLRIISWGVGVERWDSRVFIMNWLYQKGGVLSLFIIVIRLLICIIGVINIAKLDEGPIVKT